MDLLTLIRMLEDNVVHASKGEFDIQMDPQVAHEILQHLKELYNLKHARAGQTENPFEQEQKKQEDFSRRFYEDELNRAFREAFGGTSFHEWAFGPGSGNQRQGPFGGGGGGGQKQEQYQYGWRKPQTKKPWHEVLGVKPNATRHSIKKAWQKLAMIHHPDRGGSNERMAEINAARDEGLGGL